MEQRGFLLSFRSSYLVERNIIQICLMGDCRREMLVGLPDLLARLGTPTL